MYTYTHITLAALFAAAASPLMAQGPYEGNTPTPIDRGRNLTDQQRKNMLKKFDRDRNGQIDGKGSKAASKALRSKKSGNTVSRSSASRGSRSSRGSRGKR